MPVDDLKELVKSILDQGYLMSLATVDESGPWVSDVIFVPDGLNLYWISETATRHSKAIMKNPRVAATITISNNRGEDNIGLQIEGSSEKVEGDILEIAIKHREKRHRPAPAKKGEILDPEESWYLLKPTKIEIIYEPKWGFDKKELLLK